MVHRALLILLWLVAVLPAQVAASPTEGEKIGVVLLHGKQGHTPRDQTLTQVAAAMSAAGMIVIAPEMAWSFNRLMDRHWSQAIDEIKTHVEQLKLRGAQRIVLAGQSLGSPAVMSYAARYGAVDALALISPGHTPRYFYEGIPFAPRRIWVLKESVDKARDLKHKGLGSQRTSFLDINVGGTFTVWASPDIFLSYMDPDSDAEMSTTAPKIPAQTPVLWLMGKKDFLVAEGKAYVYDKLPINPKSKYIEVEGGHFDAGGKNADLIVQWIKHALAP
ncbi:MAG: hypothetical protein RIS88_2499 [Pseudomonadota bacterium]|jgi:pimeloyl-ACP methyl ester carboxylesterase